MDTAKKRRYVYSTLIGPHMRATLLPAALLYPLSLSQLGKYFVKPAAKKNKEICTGAAWWGILALYTVEK